jgi:hypothetical protein
LLKMIVDQVKPIVAKYMVKVSYIIM